MPAPSCGLCGAKDFTQVEDVIGIGTVIDSLTPLVDCLRDLQTQLGARQYEVSLVWTQWTGGERGTGAESVVKVLPLLPTPMVSNLDDGLRRELQMIGMEEVGNIRIRELSPRFNEDLLLGQAVVVPLGARIPADMSFYWEVFFPRVGSAGVRRRFQPKSAPNKTPTNFEWSIELVKVSEDRGRDGLPA